MSARENGISKVECHWLGLKSESLHLVFVYCLGGFLTSIVITRLQFARYAPGNCQGRRAYAYASFAWRGRNVNRDLLLLLPGTVDGCGEKRRLTSYSVCTVRASLFANVCVYGFTPLYRIPDDIPYFHRPTPVLHIQNGGITEAFCRDDLRFTAPVRHIDWVYS